MNQKEITFDVETSGTYHYDRGELQEDGTVKLLKQNGILQLTAKIKIGGETKSVYNEYMQPLRGQLIDPGALKVNGITMEQIQGFQTPREAFDKFMDIINVYIDPYDKKDKFTLSGYNARFDDNFLRQWFTNIDPSVWYGSYFRWPAIDISNMAAEYIGDGWKTMENFKLMTVAEKLGIEIDESRAHDSLYDVEITELIHGLLRGEML